MLERGNIIEQALILVGNINEYNDNRSKTYQMATKLLDKIVDTACGNNDFNFPSTTVTLTESVLNSETGEYRYNIPVDFLGIKKKITVNTRTPFKVESIRDLVASSQRVSLRVEGEYIYSYNNPLILNYVRKIPLKEFPAYMEDYLIHSLAVKLAQALPAYADKLPLLKQELKEMKADVTLAEGSGLPLKLRGDVTYGER